MKVVIGKRDGLVIVSGGGSLEEQKNNLKDWEVLDTESGALKEDLDKKEEVKAKKYKIDPEDIYISLTDSNAGFDTSLFHGAYDANAGIIPANSIENKVYWDKTKKDYRKTSELNDGIGVSATSYGAYNHANVRLYKPVLEDGVYKIIIPYIDSIDGESMAYPSLLTTNAQMSIHLGNPCIYGKEKEEGGELIYYSEHNFTALRKKYGIDEIEGFNNSDNDFAIVPIGMGVANDLISITNIHIDFSGTGEGSLSGTFNGVMTKERDTKDTLGRDFMPDPTNALGKIIELPEIKIEIAVMKENP